MKPTTPEEQVDHINGIRTDCRRENLRIVTHAENMQNKGVQRINATGVRGVTFDPKKQLYHAMVTVDGVKHSGGRHKQLEDAEQAASELRARLMTHTNEERRRKVSGT